MITFAVPLFILFRSDGNTLDSIGYEAEDKYAELLEDNNQTKWFFFRRFSFHNVGLQVGLSFNGFNLKEITTLYNVPDKISYFRF